MNRKPYYIGIAAIVFYISATHLSGIYFTSYPWLSRPLSQPVFLYDIVCGVCMSLFILALNLLAKNDGFLRWLFHIGFLLSVLWLWRFISDTAYMHISSAVPTAILVTLIGLYERRLYKKYYKK